MKTKLFLFATLLISTIAFSQTSKKGYDYYAASSQLSASKKMNKGELIDAMAKDAKSSTKKYGKMGNHPNITQHNSLNSNSRQKSSRVGRNPQTGKAIKNARNTNGLPTGRRTERSQGDPVPGIGITKEQGYQGGSDLYVRKRPGRTKYKTSQLNQSIDSLKATDYNSSRSNKSL